MNTKQRLAQRLESLGAHGLAEHARKGLYSDFESEVATPKVLLLADLRVLGLHEMVHEVMNGEWDDSAEEAEAWAAAHTGETREMIESIRANKAREKAARKQPDP
jgi:hypothetical protein